MNKRIKFIVITILVLLFAVVVYKSPILKDAFSVVALSAIIAYSLLPIQSKLVEKGMSKKISCILILFVLFITVGIMLFYLMPRVLKDIVNISTNLSQINDFTEKVNIFVDKYFKNKYTSRLLSNVSFKVENRIKAFSSGIVENLMKKGDELFSLSVVPIIVYYFLTDGKNLSTFIMMLVPVRKRRLLRNFLYDINIVLSRYVITQFLLSFIVIIMTFLVLIVFKIKFPLMLSLLNGVFNIIPYFGPIFGAVPILVIGALNAPKKLLWLMICLNLIQQVEGDIIAPKMTGDTVNIHPLVIIILLIIGGKIGGLFGMVLAVPVAVVLKVIKEDVDYYMY
ncbi:AI-2E family transporter [Clostridium oryzae]|uniref:AI-2 transport protein TqsA n=1 Tax=Clostridium oryzae TaxID=1450648 RepID=A0A1V4IUX7_9CLOT|nr:AI-2E family transporter [Clostridium oryzae]OPJ63620.1 AI-2 transport protein TqsA [Clostridium oryzae]